ncbi:MAG TPA: 2-dehydro-3-deoxygluconokinase [Chloroflexi bacterium]|nr:2-dehydro-3-deoxygluconokinase [Chloroflexota bacterium]
MKIVTFGEIMLRLAPPGVQRFTLARSLEATYGGGEANVAVSLANYGEEVDFITRLPENDLGDACINTLRGLGVGTRFIARGGERIGIYFLETGAAQRASKVIYDRAGSSFATIQPGSMDWKAIFTGADWFHWTGITPSVSQGAADICREAILAAREMGVTISTDLNYRAKLWKWGKTAGEVMSDLVGMCDVALGNEEDAEKVFGIHAPESDVGSGRVAADHYRFVCEKLAERFPSLKTISITLRGSLSASHNTWSGVLWCNGEFYSAPTYDIVPIVDRVGGGDSFMGGLIYGLRKYPSDPQKALNFAAAAACLKHSIPGDFNVVSVAEVETLVAGDASGRVSR